MWEQSWQSWKVQVSYNKGGEWDWCPNPHFQWFIFRIPGWHCIAGVLLSAEGVILPAEGVLLSGHIEFPGHITLQVSLRVTLSFLVTCHGHSEFPGHLSIITWIDTWISWNCSWMRHHPNSYTGCILVAGHLEYVPGCDIIQTRTLDASSSGSFFPGWHSIRPDEFLRGPSFCTDMHILFCQFFRLGLYSPLSVKKNPPEFSLELFFVF